MAALDGRLLDGADSDRDGDFDDINDVVDRLANLTTLDRPPKKVSSAASDVPLRRQAKSSWDEADEPNVDAQWFNLVDRVLTRIVERNSFRSSKETE